MNDDSLGQMGMAAALAKSYAEDAHGFLPSLAVFLEGVMPDKTEVERKSLGFFSGKKRVVGLKLTIGDCIYVLHEGRHAGQLEAQRSKIVRGVTLKTETIPIPALLEEVSAMIADETRQNESAADALKAFLGH